MPNSQKMLKQAYAAGLRKAITETLGTGSKALGPLRTTVMNIAKKTPRGAALLESLPSTLGMGAAGAGIGALGAEDAGQGALAGGLAGLTLGAGRALGRMGGRAKALDAGATQGRWNELMGKRFFDTPKGQKELEFLRESFQQGMGQARRGGRLGAALGIPAAGLAGYAGYQAREPEASGWTKALQGMTALAPAAIGTLGLMSSGGGGMLGAQNLSPDDNAALQALAQQQATPQVQLDPSTQYAPSLPTDSNYYY